MANNISYYFHKQNWSIDTTPPGLRIGTLTTLAVSAVLGLLFVVFLPVIGFVLSVRALIEKFTAPQPKKTENSERAHDFRS